MAKSFIVLDEKELLAVERICLDKDPQEALAFVLQSVAPKIKKVIRCLGADLMRPQR